MSTIAPCGDHTHKNPAQRKGSLRQNYHTRSRPTAKTHTSNSWNKYPPTSTTNSEVQPDQHVQVSATTCEKSFEILSLSTALLPLCLPHPSISLATEKTESNSSTVFNRFQSQEEGHARLLKVSTLLNYFVTFPYTL